ncbi:uncharacterized protein LOC118196615 [Stegodyphus dumicola]|uniref:uncharacterized protein LOC118196615 n=1 Tax=Stegodyphus dumicola TaxID=202533 RepID=UPI0015B021FF|nr:uncharacterized protein LOC118196615 [Stegodyphus dumicola]
MINEDNPTRREREWLKNSSPKSYVRCVACNANSWYFPERKFFRFPKDPERSKEWAIACGKRFLLDMSPSDLYKKCRVCSAHFVDSDFCTLKKHFLHLRAKPRKFSKTENCGKTYLNNFECSRLQLNSPDSSSSIDREVLIERVKSYPVLYNPLHKDYADVEMKENIWSKIAQQLKCASGYKVEEQWLRLRKGYKSALRQQKMKGNGRCETKKCWAYEKQMGFLLPFLTDRSVSPSVQKTADGKMSHPFQEECNAQDEDSSSSSIITCDDAFNNHYLSERSISKTYPVTERPLNESSMISDDRESAGTPDQRTANEESSGSFKSMISKTKMAVLHLEGSFLITHFIIITYQNF